MRSSRDIEIILLIFRVALEPLHQKVVIVTGSQLVCEVVVGVGRVGEPNTSWGFHCMHTCQT